MCVRIFGVRILGVILPRKISHMFFKFDFVILIELINKKTDIILIFYIWLNECICKSDTNLIKKNNQPKWCELLIG